MIEKKRTALLEQKSRENRLTLSTLKVARSEMQRASRKCANEYWLNLCSDIQNAADIGNIRGVYEGIKKTVGLSCTKTAPLGSANGTTTTDKIKKMERWVEHYSESRGSTISAVTPDAVESKPSMIELDESVTGKLFARILLKPLQILAQ